MKNRFRMFPRTVKGNIVYYCEDTLTGKQTSLRTKDKDDALDLLAVKNQTDKAPSPAHNLQIARMYLLAGDARYAERTWAFVLESIKNSKDGETRDRWERVKSDKALSGLWEKPIIKTSSEDLLAALRKGKVSTNVFLRRLHNFAVDMAWIPAPIVPKRQWPKIRYKEKRAITAEEHKKIIEREKNPERRAFYELCWLLGGSQGDVAKMEASCIDLKSRVLAYHRKKTDSLAKLRFGDSTAAVLNELPKAGPLFPYLRTIRASDRATEFKQRCKSVNVSGVTLHSYRYAWAERSANAGYAERFAQQALGQNSKAVHRAYAKRADTTLPSLEDMEKKIIQMPTGEIARIAAAG